MRVALWAEIHRLKEIERLSSRQIARRLRCSRSTVKAALALLQPPVPNTRPRGSILDPYQPRIDRLIERTPNLSAVRVLEELRKESPPYPGEITLVRYYLRKARPHTGRVYHEVDWPPGDAMQVDWGACGTVLVGETPRRVSVLVVVLCHSRRMYIEFALSQKGEHFYRAMGNALTVFGGATARIIVDNFKTAVLRGSGRDAVFQPEFLAFCGHYRMQPVACEKADPETKGVVEGGVGYVKRNALQGRQDELTTFAGYRRLQAYWPEKVANVRDHRTTHQRPIDRFQNEQALLRPLPAVPYDTDAVHAVKASSHARVWFEGNRYSVPPTCARKTLLLRASAEQIRILHEGVVVATHPRCYQRRQIVVAAEHREAVRARRSRSRASELERRLDGLGSIGERFRRGIRRAQARPLTHMARILELSRIYGKTEVLEALERAAGYEAFDAAYVENLIAQQRRRRQLPSPLPITPRRRELVEDLDLEEPDLCVYDRIFQTDQESDDGTA